MSYWTLTDGTNVVSMAPHWGLEFDDKKVETTHRTRDGSLFKYRWGGYKRTKFDIDFVNSSDAARINSWWMANTPLKLVNPSSVVVHSGYLMNSSLPINKYVEPYTDEFSGTIELESA